MLNTDYKRNLNRNRGRGWSVPTVLLAAITVVAGAIGDTHAQCQYEVTAIIQHICPSFGDGSPTFGQGLNINGEIVGYYWPCAIGNDRAFFWSQDTGFVTLPNPPGVIAARAYDINDDRMIVGQHLFPSVGWKGFAYDMATGEYKHLEPLHDGATATSVSSANAINNAGVVAGMRIIGKPGTPNPPRNAVIWDTNTGEITDLGVMEGPNSWASDIPNTSTDTVGSTGTLSQGVGYRQVDSNVELVSKFLKFSNSFCHGAGDFGFVAGSGIPIGSNDSSGFLWVDDNLILLDPLPGFSNCGANDVNAYGHVITRCTPGNVPGLWQNGETFDLRELIVSGGGSIQWPRAINNNGQILTRSGGGTSAALLTPIDVPLGDLNFDCKVDGHDLSFLLNAWGPQPITRGADGPQPQPADLNGDGVVDGTDLLILLANWNP